MQSVQRVQLLGSCICICRCSVFFFFFDFMSKPVLSVGERLDRINLGVHVIYVILLLFGQKNGSCDIRWCRLWLFSTRQQRGFRC